MTESLNNEYYFHKRLHEAALDVARNSPCVRRQYGVVIGYKYAVSVFNNERVCNSCNDGCIRTRLHLRPGEHTEIGAEVHAEQAALVTYGPALGDETLFLAGIQDGKEMLDPKPCPSCAKLLLFAKFKEYVTKTKDGYVRNSVLGLVLKYQEEQEQKACKNA